ncbi:MAG: DNA polymerase III subunit delta [Candidatus Kapaibacteriota bacterium]
MIISPQEIFRSKNIPYCYTIFGEEDYLVNQAYREYLSFFQNYFSDLQIEIFDLEDVKSSEELINIIDKQLVPSFFATTKLITFKGIEKFFNKKGRKSKTEPSEIALRRLLLNPTNNLSLLIISFDESLYGFTKKFLKDRNSTESLIFPFNVLLSKYYWIEFPKLLANQIPSWVKSELDKLAFTIDKEALDFFLSNTNPNLWEMHNELEKVCAYLGDKKRITLDDLTTVLSGNKEINIFKITSMIARKDIANSFLFINKILSVSKQELLLLNIIYKFFKNLLVLFEISKKTKEKAVLAKSIGVSPYFLDDYLMGIRNFTKSEAESALSEIVKLDHQLKISSKDSKFLFFSLINKILSLEKSFKNS